MHSPSPPGRSLMALPRRIIVRIMRRLCERDVAALATTCRMGTRIARHTSWSASMRFKSMCMRVSPPGSAPSVPGVTPISSASVEIISIIMTLLGPSSMLNFALTCTTYNTAYKKHMLSVTYQSLNKFDLPPERFMRILLATSSIIGGSVPANILSGQNYVPNDLDVFTPSSREDSMRVIFTEELGFKAHRSTLPEGMQNTTRMMHTFKKNNKSVRLWIASGENPSVPVMLTPSTFVMNFISPWGIYCAYPRLTLLRRAILNHFTDDGPDCRFDITYRRVSDACNKYTDRGVAFEFDDRNWIDTARGHRCYVTSTCTHTTRNLYDSWGMHIPFPIEYEGVKPFIAKNTRLDGHHTTIWSLGGDYCNDPVLYHRAFAQSKNLYVRIPADYDSDTDSDANDGCDGDCDTDEV
ncbi:hypothetical protein C8F04DRAFT_1198093 [Mycena alexandri]|uniref:F-box domain-containing protein n=1 Tax=Mycena alexandri TaxID=1745969 RepID=A0AAD6WLX8_9AGAR|nr:hypothetical protein C8F04DRAFT_1198093 [Mycena alexandri]